MDLRSLIALPFAATLLLAGCSQGGQIAAEAAQPATSGTASASDSASTTKPSPTAKGRASSEASAASPKASPELAPKPSATASAGATAKKSSTPPPAPKAPATSATSGAYIDTPPPTPEAPATSAASGAYIDYATWDSNRSKYGGTDVVLFFHADWCPKCRDTDASAKSGVPAGLTLVKIDYDNATGLRQTYGVTLQHTFVQIDQAGNALKKWVGTYSDNSVAWVQAQTV